MSKIKSLRLLFAVTTGLCLMVGTTTCTDKPAGSGFSEQFSMSTEKAVLLVATNPDASSQILDSIVKIIPLKSLSNTQVVVYLQLKSEAFIKLGMKDSAYALMKRYYEGDLLAKNSKLKIYSGLWLARNYNADGKNFLAQKYLDQTLLLLENETQGYAKSMLTNETINDRLLLINSPLRDNPVFFGIVLFSILMLGALVFRLYMLYQQRDEDYNVLFEKYRNETLPKAAPLLNVETGENQATEKVFEDTDIMYPQLIEYFETGKPYLRSNLRFDDVANELIINRKILSHLIMKHTGMNFNSFVNSYRTKEAIRLLAEPQLKQYKIEAIAHKAGFGSKASFYLAFNQITGSIPSEHR